MRSALPKPHSLAMVSTGRTVCSSSQRAASTRALSANCAGVSPTEILFYQGQGQIDPRGDPARGVDIPVASEDEIWLDPNRRVCRREEF